MSPPALEDTLQQQDATLAKLHQQAEQLKAADGTLDERGKVLAEVRAQEEIVQAEREATLDAMRRREAVKKHGQREATLKQIADVDAALEQEDKQVLQTLRSYWAEPAVERVRWPGSHHALNDTSSNDTVRLTFEEKRLLEEREELTSAARQLEKEIHALEASDND